jgi:DNA-directed RNA polymerase sigma subunit (sigma70/sigma32)
MLSKEEEQELWRKWRHEDDQEALPILINSMTPLLRKNVNKFRSTPIPLPALEAEARTLAVKAFETYDPSKAQLNTHVTNHLKHLQRYVLNYQNVGKIPETRGVKITRYKNIKTQLADDYGRDPTLAELSDELSWALPEVERMESELRSDLSIVEGKEESFFDYSLGNEDNVRDIMWFIYVDEDAVGKKILEHTFEIGGALKLNSTQLAKQLRVPETVIRKRKRQIAEKIHKVQYK